MTLLLKRGDGGFGFRVVGGDEEGSQVGLSKSIFLEYMLRNKLNLPPFDIYRPWGEGG